MHEIVVKEGFLPQLFEERHYQRQFVSEYLTGWVAPPKEKVDNIIGFSPERIEEIPSSIPLESIGLARLAPIINSFSGKNLSDSIPMDYLPERGVSTNPFTKKRARKCSPWSYVGVL